jgi:PadR family transcriptional regulator, regulatory protein PadR
MKAKGHLRSSQARSGRTTRHSYRATAIGRKALANAKYDLRELFGELFEDDWEKP